LANWWSQPLSGGTHPTAITSTDDFDLNGHSMFLPNITGTSTFAGSHLVLHGGNDGFLNGKTNPATNTIVIPNLISYGGYMGQGAYTGILPVYITNFVNNANTTITGGSSGRGWNVAITTLTGTGDITATGNNGTAAGGSLLFNVTTATSFTGTLYIADGCQFTFANAMTSGGALDVHFSPGTTVTVNANVTFKGLSINGVAKATGTYTAASLGFAGTGSVIVQAAAAPSHPPVTTMIGVNLPGAGFGTPFYPTDALVWDYLKAKNANLVRIAFKWERVQPTLNGPLDSGAMASLDTVVALARARNIQVFLDMHNYLNYNIAGTSYQVGSTQVPYSALQDVWNKLAAHYATETAIFGYDIMNEPGGTVANWNSAAQAAINGIRLSDTTHNVIVESVNWSHAEGWMNTNATLNVTDSANKIVYSAHTYWSNSGNDSFGTYDAEHGTANMGVNRVAAFVHWCKLKNARGLIGEFGVPNNVASPEYGWNVALDKFLAYLNANGCMATYWSMTQNGWPNTYPLLCATGGKAPGPVVDAPAMAVLQNYFGGGGGLPVPWAAGDVGTVTPSGTSTYSGSTFTVNTGSGLDFMAAYASDGFTYAYQPASGDCDIIARVATLSAGDVIKAEAAVMIRNDLTANSTFAAMGVSTGRGLHYTCRLTTGATNTDIATISGTVPYWVRLTRTGNTFTAYQSTTGTTWTQLGTPQTITMGTSVYIGLPVCNHGGTGVATFDNVTVTP